MFSRVLVSISLISFFVLSQNQQTLSRTKQLERAISQTPVLSTQDLQRSMLDEIPSQTQVNQNPTNLQTNEQTNLEGDENNQDSLENESSNQNQVISGSTLNDQPLSDSQSDDLSEDEYLDEYMEEVMPRRTEFGSLCQFPMSHEDEIYNDCIWGSDGKEYCKVDGFMYICESMWPDHELAKQEEDEKIRENTPLPDPSEVIERFTVKGQKCELPKWYNGRYLTDCLYISSKRELCFFQNKWHYCAPLKAPKAAPMQQTPQQAKSTQTQARYTIEGDMCIFPFEHVGKTYYDCIEQVDGKQWCKVQGNNWKQCAASIVDESLLYAGYDRQRVTDSDTKKGSQNAVVGLSVVLVLLFVIGIIVGIKMASVQRNINDLQKRQPIQLELR
eukprot:TRINITY_DN6175_c0_g1_i1.p1 TRINITY_DN6175_c0_g1~~TRINITY_DN6175_c0_g1_i1.p1  ORF type:complete len:387 (-),score=39.11 TRINITY_DN6175_c0_g1_i1:420-1580(-)